MKDITSAKKKKKRRKRGKELMIISICGQVFK